MQKISINKRTKNHTNLTMSLVPTTIQQKYFNSKSYKNSCRVVRFQLTINFRDDTLYQSLDPTNNVNSSKRKNVYFWVTIFKAIWLYN